MSGGHWNYEGFKCVEHLKNIGNDGEVIQIVPKLAQVFRDLADIVEAVDYELDKHLSGGRIIEDIYKFELNFLSTVNKAINKKAKFKVYESEVCGE